MIKGSKLKPRLSKVCKNCTKDFLARQANAGICDECREYRDAKIPCKCGCGKMCIQGKSGFAAGCKSRGKTYKEIYKNEEKKRPGFKKGILNPNYTRSKFIGLKLTNSTGEKFRSSLEVKFSEFCIKNNIKYEYEGKVRLIDGRLKIVDFILDDLIYVEVTGFAYPKWKSAFIEKMKVLRRSINQPILILTYGKFLKEDFHELSITKLYDIDVFIEDVDNEESILKKIKMFELNYKINNYLLNPNPINRELIFKQA